MDGFKEVGGEYYKMEQRLSFWEAVLTCLHKWKTFSGRARRSEFLWWHLFVCVVWGICGVAIVFLLGSIEEDNLGLLIPLIIILCIIAIGAILPTLAVFWRRCHDVGHTGLLIWILVLGVIVDALFLPVAGGAEENIVYFIGLQVLQIVVAVAVWPSTKGEEMRVVTAYFYSALILVGSALFPFLYLWLLSADSDAEENEYGPSPKYSKEEWASQEE